MTEIEARYSPHFLEKLAGKNLTSNPKTAIIELIANAWDAGATRVDITWPETTGSFFEIKDNGHGMSKEEFEKRFMTISYDRINNQGEEVTFPDTAIKQTKRYAYGKNGLGRFGGFYFSDKYFVATSDGKNGTHSFEVTKTSLPKTPIKAKLISNTKTIDEQGTIIYTNIIETININVEDIRTEIGMRFLSDPNFQIFVNSKLVDLMDIPTKNIYKLIAAIDGTQHTIEIIAIDANKPDSNTHHHGIAWHVNGRLVGDCNWKGPNNEKFLDGRKNIAKRFTFIIKANCLSDLVLPDWTGFNYKDHLYSLAVDSVHDQIFQFLNKLSREEKAALTSEIKQQNSNLLKQLSPIELETWTETVDQLQTECYNLSDEMISQIAKLLANLQVSRSRFALLQKLSKYTPDQLDDLHNILQDWTLDMAKIVLDEIQTRIRLVHELEKKVKDKHADELHDLQPLFEAGLWIFGPEYDSIHYTSNRGMTTVLKQLFKIDEKGSTNRPDFVIIPDGSIGIYSLPDYDEDGQESGIEKVVIVELKKPGIYIGNDQKNQCWKYIKELISIGAITESTVVKCFVLGQHIEANESGIRTEKDGRIKIVPMLYDTVMTRANSRLLNLKTKIESAPFLQKDLEAFTNLSKNTDTQSEMAVGI